MVVRQTCRKGISACVRAVFYVLRAWRLYEDRLKGQKVLPIERANKAAPGLMLSWQYFPPSDRPAAQTAYPRQAVVGAPSIRRRAAMQSARTGFRLPIKNAVQWSLNGIMAPARLASTALPA